MATPQNLYLLNLARCAESVAQGERGQINYPHNRVEVLASCVQALLQTLGGGQPTTTAMPPDQAMGLSDLVQTSGQRANLTWAEFVPFFPFGTFATGNEASVLVDGTVHTVVYATPFANQTSYVFPSIKNNYASNPWALNVQVFNYTKTGFDVYIAGGPTGSTCALDYLSVGS